MMNTFRSLVLLFFPLLTVAAQAQQPVPSKPRILVSTDIGGTDPDDNQSMAHLLMYSDRFTIEGLVSSPSYGEGNKEEILRMIGLYEKDLPRLKAHRSELADPDYLRSVTKQGRRGTAPWAGYSGATEGSEWIVECAQKESGQPLWVLVWGGLDDLAQALHDAPEIQSRIRVYWIGGPNKKWSANSYAYIAEHFPALWFIEDNSSYYGFFSKNIPDAVDPSNYYEQHIRGGGYLGADFKNYLNGEIKMGDTPSLLYMMDGDPNDPTRESWGGSFERLAFSSRVVFDRATSLTDTVAFCAVVEYRFEGPEADIAPDSACFWMDVPYGNTVQRWAGYYLGGGRYGLRYIPKQAETLRFRFVPAVPGLSLPSEGALVVDNRWPGKRYATDYPLGADWYTDKGDPALYVGRIQGGKTVSKWRQDALMDWARRWKWLTEDSAEQAFAAAEQLPWTVAFEDDLRSGIETNWLLDGTQAQVSPTPRGLEIVSGPQVNNDSAHVVLWTRERFSGPLKIEYDFTRLDDSPAESVCIVYLHAAGSGVGPYAEDITAWSDLRRVPAMKCYFDRMNAYHISYAVTSPATEGGDYVRARRYVPETGKGLSGTALTPEYDRVDWFRRGVTYRMTVILSGDRLYLQASDGTEKRLFWFDTSTLPPLDEGYIGLRQMWARASRYANFRVSTIVGEE